MNKLIKYSEITGLFKQLGSKVILFQNGRAYGYEILTYNGLEPDTLRLVDSIENPPHKVLSMDTAYDKIFGNPIYNY